MHFDGDTLSQIMLDGSAASAIVALSRNHPYGNLTSLHMEEQLHEQAHIY